MAANYPTSLDVEAGVGGSASPVPDTTDNTDTPSHAALHQKEGDAIVAVETKIGTGSSTPADNKVLTGTGSGTSAWGTVDVNMMGANSVDSDQYVDGSIDTAHLADDQVTAAKTANNLNFQTDDSAWASWAPTITGWAIGNGTFTGTYMKLADLVTCTFSLICGSTTSYGSKLIIPLPVTPTVQQYLGYVLGTKDIDIGFINVALGRAEADGTLAIFAPFSTGRINNAGLTSIIPHTWATGDSVFGTFSYKAA